MMEYRTSPTNEYPVRIPPSLVGSIRESTAVQPTPLRNLHKDFLEITEEMQVYVRIKPSKEDGNVLSIQDNFIVVQPPRDSASFKNKNNAGTKTLQKFKFNKIYDSSISQEKLFKDSALNLVQDFLLGKNTLLFTYGATSAGKTYTMLGSVREAGLLPRSLDVIFNSLEERLLKNPLLKPLALNDVMRLNCQQMEAEELERTLLMRGFDLDCSDSKDSISTISSCSIKDWNIRSRETIACSLQYPKDHYTVWVSYCEIYNEQAFDLLDSCDKKKKRTPLRITEDRKGKFYVKGLKEICVRTADDAVRVLLFGKENLHFAATKLNHNSSRSHCVFTIKVIRTNDREEPTEAAINMMSFVDLAGMERTNKTQSRGERLKEAGNINTSLLILGRCIDAMRMNQTNPQNKNMIPYRESKLTRILQTFFSGQGRAAMYVNVSPSPLLCDETLHVLKFGALAQEVVMQQESSVADMSISQFAPPVRPSRFQQYVRKSISLLTARASVIEPIVATVEEEDASERVQELEDELAKFKSEWDENEQKIREECCNEWSEVFSRMERTWNERYEEMKARYEEFCENRVGLVSQLMNNCVKKKRRMVDDEDLEDVAMKLKDKDDRIDILEESNGRLTELVEKLKSNLKASEDGKAELQQEMTKLQFEMASLKKPQINFVGLEIDDEEVHTDDIVKKLEAKLRSKEEMLNEAVLEFHTKSEELNKVQQESESLKLKNAQTLEEITNLQAKLEHSNLLLSDANERLDAREEELMNLEEKVAKANNQYRQIQSELKEAKLRAKDLETRLEEEKNTRVASHISGELAQLHAEYDALKLKHSQALEKVETLQAQLERSEASLNLANERLEIREEELMNLEQEVSKANGQHCHLNTELREARRKIRELETRLNDQSNTSAISNMCEDLQRQLLEADTKLEKRDEEIQNLKVKLDHYKRLAEKTEESNEELETLRERFDKSQLQLSIAQKELRSLKTLNEDVKARRESLLDQLSHLKKDIEVSNAERKRDEVDQAELREENEKLHKAIDQMRQTQIQLLEENEDFRKTIAEYDETINELTAQMETLKNAQRNSCLLEEELKTLAASLGRLQLEKSQMEREATTSRNEGEKLKESVRNLEEENVKLKTRFEENREKISSLEQEVERLTECSTNSSVTSENASAKINHLKSELSKCEDQVEALNKECTVKTEQMNANQMKYDELERSFEKLNKEMLKHMMRAEELTETVKLMQDELNNKNKKCDLFSKKISELESHIGEFKNVQNLLVEKEITLREKENQNKAMQEKLEKNELVVDQLKRENARILQEKNLDVARLELELKSLLSGHVDYRKSTPVIKVEKEIEAEQNEEQHPIAATPTPVKTRKGRSKKPSSPEEVDENKPETSTISSSTRSRRTVKTDFAAPSSTSKTPARKSRKAKSEVDEAIHPALSLHAEEPEATESNPSSTSKRRLYNSKFPDVLLPTKKEESEALEFPKRMATRSRRQ